MSAKMLESQIEKRRVSRDELKKIATSTQQIGKHILPTGDVHRPSGADQNFLVLSYVTGDGKTRVTSLKGLCFKFSGTFKLLEDAKNHARLIRDENPLFDVSVVDLYEWGVIPLPDEERAFVAKEYTDPLLTRAVVGLQRSMVQGKKELEERKARDRSKAEAQMMKIRGKDYKMPEKSADLAMLETKIQEERKDEEKSAASENRRSEIRFDMSQISNIVMMYCTENNGEVIDISSGARIMRFFAEKSIELEAQLRREIAGEFPDEAPATLPTAEEVDALDSAGDTIAPACE